jgi:hypothetical protein
MAPNALLPSHYAIIMLLEHINVSVAGLICLTVIQNLNLAVAGPAFTSLPKMGQSVRPMIAVSSCVAPKCIVAGVMRILVMCFLMGPSPRAYAIASIRRRWILLIKKQATNRRLICDF